MTATAQLVAGGLDFPTSVAVDPAGDVWVAESGLAFGGARPGGRLRRLTGEPALLGGNLRPPVNGILWHDGGWIVAEGGNPGRLSHLGIDGGRRTLLDGLPGFGNYQTNMCVRGADGKLYFSQGAMTNLGVVGPDSFDVGWLGEHEHDADIPGHDVAVSAATFETPDPRRPGATACTGAFAAFGTPGAERRIPGRVPCTAAVLRCEPDGTGLELVAWGLRNAYGLVVLPDGRLLATDQGADDRGSRPVADAPDLLVEVEPGYWYGWPDYVGRTPVTDARFRNGAERPLEPVLTNHDELPPLATPLLEFPAHASATKLAVIPEGSPRFAGQLLVCLFGDERPMTAPAGPRAGRRLARVDLDSAAIHPVRHPPVHRPIDVCVHDGAAYLLDFGSFEMTSDGVDAVPGSGAVHRIPLSEL